MCGARDESVCGKQHQCVQVAKAIKAYQLNEPWRCFKQICGHCPQCIQCTLPFSRHSCFEAPDGSRVEVRCCEPGQHRVVNVQLDSRHETEQYAQGFRARDSLSTGTRVPGPQRSRLVTRVADPAYDIFDSCVPRLRLNFDEKALHDLPLKRCLERHAKVFGREF